MTMAGIVRIASTAVCLAVVAQSVKSQAVDPPKSVRSLLRPYRDTYFDFFITQLGDEDVTAKGDTADEKKPRTKTNYSRLFGISEDEEAAMRRILVEAFYRLKANDEEYLQRSSAYSTSRNASDYSLRMVNERRSQIYIETLDQLKRGLTSNGFKRVDSEAFNQYFIARRAQLRDTALRESGEEESIPRSKSGELNQYELFAEQLCAEEASGAETDWPESSRRRSYSQMLYISETEEQRMRQILVSTYRELKETDAEVFRVIDETRAHPELVTQLNAEEEALAEKRSKIILTAIGQLKQELSDDGFKRVDLYAYGNVFLPSPDRLAQLAALGSHCEGWMLPEKRLDMRPGECPIYEMFIKKLGAHENQGADSNAEQATATIRDLSALLHMSTANEQSIRRIVLQAYQQLAILERVNKRDNERCSQSDDSNCEFLRSARTFVVRKAIDELRGKLGDDAFNRLDSYVYDGVVLPFDGFLQ